MENVLWIVQRLGIRLFRRVAVVVLSEHCGGWESIIACAVVDCSGDASRGHRQVEIPLL